MPYQVSPTPTDPNVLRPQPDRKPPVVPDPEEVMRRELQENKTRIDFTREVMAEMKEEIRTCTRVLEKEIGKYIDIAAVVRTGGPGPHGRTQELINLRLRLAALNSQFVEPVHKFRYLGPFDPRKKFDVAIVPLKQENLYEQMLTADKEVRLLTQEMPLETLREQMKELSLMHKSTSNRRKILKKGIRETRTRLLQVKAETRHRIKVIEYMIGHQKLLKLMLDPQTISLDGTLRDFKADCVKRGVIPEQVPGPFKFKTLYDQTERDLSHCQDKLLSLAEKLDSNTDHLVKAEELCIHTRCVLPHLEHPPEPENPKKKHKPPPKKGKSHLAVEPEVNHRAEEELKWLKEENARIRGFLLSPLLSNRIDYDTFLMTLALAKKEFLDGVDDVKRALCRQVQMKKDVV